MITTAARERESLRVAVTILANSELPKEIDRSMFEGLDFEAMASRPRTVGRPKRLEH